MIFLLDIMIPGMLGDEVVEMIMRIKPRQVVLVMTSHGTLDLEEIILVKCASDYIQKIQKELWREVCDIVAKREDFLVSGEQFWPRLLDWKV